MMGDDILSEARDRPVEEIVPPAEPAGDATPLFPRIRSVMLSGIFVLLLFYTLYLAAEIIIPLCFAVLLKLLLQPAVRALQRLRIPSSVAALVVIIVLFSSLAMVGYALSGPATAWIERAPESLPRLEQQLRVLQQPVQQLMRATQRVEKLAEAPSDGATVTVKGPGLMNYLFTGTRSILVGFGITVLMLFFLLASGDLFMRKLVEILPSFRDKKQAVTMSH